MPENSNNKQSNKPNSTPPEKSGFNWRVWILVAIGLSVIIATFFGGGNGFGSKTLTLKEFKNELRAGKIILNDEKNPLEVVHTESSTQSSIRGSMVKEDSDVSVKEMKNFRTEVNLKLLSDNIKKQLIDLGLSQTQTDKTPDFDAQKDQSCNLKEVEKFLSRGEIFVDKEHPLKLYIGDEKNSDTAWLTGTYVVREWPENKKNSSKARFEVPIDRLSQGEEVSNLLGDTANYKTESDTWSRLLYTIGPFLIIFLILFFLFQRQMRSGTKGAMSFGKSRAKLLNQEKNRKTFKDVAGLAEAKEEVWEIVEFLRDPKKFQRLGGSIPKGILMVGSPGTGKTLLAKAIAGEANVPFFSISGSDFVEMFVGVGASRVRDMFEQGKKNAPCLIFIDEIDAVGRHRGYGVGGGHDEREQTLNALLVEMDGFDTNEGVIIIAATNRPDVLDPALLRPGRFDREVTVNLPDVKGREEILQVHVRKIKLAENTDLSIIARGTPGFSGAELANLVNEAALLAARKGQSEVLLADLDEARDKVRWGKERRSLAISDSEKRITAVHEAGHAICLIKCEHTEPLHKVTIIPRGPSLGSTMWLPSEDKYNSHKLEMLDSLVVAMGGRCAEEVVFGDITSGAVGDIRMATNLARRMICEFGMSDKLGMVEYGESSGEVFLARDLGTRSKNYSEQTAQIIDQEIRDLIDTAYNRAKTILTTHRDGLDRLTQGLIEFETLSGEQSTDLIETGVMKNPPIQPVAPPPMPSDSESETQPETPPSTPSELPENS